MAGTGTVLTVSCGGAGVLEPGEDATVRLCLQNAGSLDTADAVATLQATGGVTNPSAAQSYGALVAGGAAVCRDFTLTVGSLSCGADLTATLQVQDGATDLGSQAWAFATGTPVGDRGGGVRHGGGSGVADGMDDDLREREPTPGRR